MAQAGPRDRVPVAPSRPRRRRWFPRRGLSGIGAGAASAAAEPLVAQVKSAIQEASLAHVHAAVTAVIQALRRRDHGFTAQHGARLLSQLWRKQLVGPVHELGDALIQAGVDASPIRRFYAEALLDQGWLAATFVALSHLEQAVAADPTERALVSELRGRGHTAAWLAAALAAPDASADELWRAVAAYHDIYGLDPRRHLLHGARAAALVLHATGDGLPAARDIPAGDIAGRVLDEIRDAEESGRPPGIDECEAGLQAALALGRRARKRSNTSSASWTIRNSMWSTCAPWSDSYRESGN